MLISFLCPKCKSKLQIDSEVAGTQIQCPECESFFLAPEKEIGPDVVIGGFQIKKLIGRGAMGEVYLAHQISMERDVALKILLSRVTKDKAAVGRFLKEVRLAAKLDHPNIVTAHEAGEDDGVYYLAMAYVKGEPLDLKLAYKGAMTEKDALELTHKIALALAYAWDEHKLLHRDIKPGNILLDAHGNPQITDMGLSKSLKESGESAADDEVVGTPNYMSPEQSEGQELDFRSDIYSLGMTLYNMLTGIVPFSGDSVDGVLEKQRTEALPDPREINPDITEACVELLALMLAKDREQRHGSWNALIGDIERVLAGEHPSKQPLGPGESAMLRVQALHGDQDDHKRIFLRHSQVMKLQDRSPAKVDEDEEKGSTSLFKLLGGLVLLVLLAALAARMMRGSDLIKDQVVVKEVVEEAQENPHVMEQEQWYQILQRKFDEALKYAKNHPNDYKGALRWFKELQKEGKGTEFEIKAAGEIKRLQREQTAALALLMDSLREQAKSLFNEKGAKVAITFLKDYKGPLAEESVAARAELGENLWAKAKKISAEKEQKEAAAQVRMDELLNTVANAMLKDDMEAAANLISEAGADPNLTPLSGEHEALRDLVEHVASLPSSVMESFKKYIGKETVVSLKNSGTQTFIIASVSPEMVKVRRKFGTGGYIQRTFTFDELSPQEQFRRLGRSETPPLDIMRGLLVYQYQKPEAAIKYFTRSAVPLGSKLSDIIKKKIADAKTGSAAKAYASLLRTANIPLDAEPTEELVRSIRRNKYSQAEVIRIRGAAKKFLKDYTETKLGRESAPIVHALANVSTVAREMDPEKLKQIITALEQVNMQSPDLVYLFDNTDAGVVMDLSKNPALIDISPLRGLPLVRLSLAGTKVKNLSPLRDMPLESLNLTGCPIEDIKDIEGLPLKQLYLGQTRVWNLAPLEDMPLELLNIAKTKVNRVSYLSESALTNLNINACPIDDIRALRELPLTTLSMAFTQVSDLRPLTGIPLTYLDITRLKVSDLSPLAGLPLKTLIFNGTHVSNLSPLKGMPLQDLRFQNTGVFDLQPLKGMELHTLMMGNTPVKDLSPLEGMPIKQLNMVNTPVNDLSPLESMTHLKNLALGPWDRLRMAQPILDALGDEDLDTAERRTRRLAEKIRNIPSLAPAQKRLEQFADTTLREAHGVIRALEENPDQAPPQAKTFRGHRYITYLFPKSWEDAVAFCKEHHAHLAVITSHQEQKFVQENLLIPGIPVRLGGSDGKREGTWTWVTGEAPTFANWFPGQPDDRRGGENSLVITTGGQWHDVNEDIPFPFMMEWNR